MKPADFALEQMRSMPMGSGAWWDGDGGMQPCHIVGLFVGPAAATGFILGDVVLAQGC